MGFEQILMEQNRDNEIMVDSLTKLSTQCEPNVKKANCMLGIICHLWSKGKVLNVPYNSDLAFETASDCTIKNICNGSQNGFYAWKGTLHLLVQYVIVPVGWFPDCYFCIWKYEMPKDTSRSVLATLYEEQPAACTGAYFSPPLPPHQKKGVKISLLKFQKEIPSN